MEQKEDKATKLIGMLPVLQKEWENMNSGTMAEYEETLNKTASKAIELLNNLIEDGTMALDIQTAVNAAAVLTKAQRDLSESKRKLIETTMKGVVMMKALQDEPQRESVLDAYAERFKLTDQTGSSNNSIFSMIDAEKNKEEIEKEATDEGKLEPSANTNGHKRGRPRKTE